MITLKNISKKYGKSEVITELTMEIPTTGLICITGESGAGKTTLLNIISLIEKPTTGTISFEGKDHPSPHRLREMRRNFGYMFQNYGLVDDESVNNNLVLGTKFSKIPKIKQKSSYILALEKVGLDESFLQKKIHTLSGGEQQRVSLARIILSTPKYIFADEPTGNLDQKNRDIVFDTLKQFSAKGTSVIYVSHDPFLINQADSTIILKK